MPFASLNVPAAFQREINRIFRPVSCIELVINTAIHVDKDEGMVVVAYSDDNIIPKKGSLEQYTCQLGKVFDLLLENNMCLEINKCAVKKRNHHY